LNAFSLLLGGAQVLELPDEHLAAANDPLTCTGRSGGDELQKAYMPPPSAAA
jgi:hypothetical protein